MNLEKIVEAANRASESLNRMTDALTSNSEKEIKSKDRVDITLEEYLAMRSELEHLRARVDRCEELFAKMGIHREIIDQIDPDDLRVHYSDFPHNDNPLGRHYQEVIVRLKVYTKSFMR